MDSESCDHCGASFDDETAYLEHLRDEHSDELSRIEQRRVAALESDDEGPSTALYAGAVGVLALLGVLAYLLFFSGGGGGTNASGGPSALGSVHYHGTIEVSIDGQQLDFSRQQFQLEADAFHFENNDGEEWHVHAQDVTLSYAMSTLGIDVTEDTLTYDGTTYGDDSGETVVVEVNGESVNPEEYVLQEGDDVRIVANASA